MSTTINHRSVLANLRAVAPPRAMYLSEALHVAELQATRLLELGNVSTAPVPANLITDLPRIQVELCGSMPVPGSTHWHSGRWIVRLARDDHPRRRRFSLAHEFKHVLDHPGRGYLYDAFNTDYRQDQIERVADTFAACLLMPKRLVCQAFYSGIQNPYELARLFAVSPAAMRVRLSQLGLLQSAARCGTTSWWQSSSASRRRPSIGRSS